MRISDWSSDVCSSDLGLWGHRVHFTCSRDAAADLGTVDYLRDTALQAGLDTGRLFIDEIRWNGKRFTDLTAKPITVLFKLYSWDRLLQEGIAGRIGPSGMRLIEPDWKMLRQEEHTSAVQSLMRNSYAVFCLQQKKTT